MLDRNTKTIQWLKAICEVSHWKTDSLQLASAEHKKMIDRELFEQMWFWYFFLGGHRSSAFSHKIEQIQRNF